MANYDELKGSMQALYNAAKAELDDIDRKRQEVLKTLELLGPICGTAKKTYSVEDLKGAEEVKKVSGRGRKAGKVAKSAAPVAKKEGKKTRIKEEAIHELVMKMLNETYPNSMAASEILDRLLKTGLPNTPSFRTRVYGLLSTWYKDGTLNRSERGVYKVVKVEKKA